jgi:hypothetical protein
MRFIRNCALGLALTLSVAGVAAAQSPTSLEAGARSISFALPGDAAGTNFGLWTMLSDQLNLGINVGLRLANSKIDGTTATKTTGISIGPAIRYYTGALGPVAPFLYGGAEFGYSKQNVPTTDGSIKNFGLSTGLGAEWFPVRSISVGGFTGLRLGHGSNSTGAVSNSTFIINTVTSGLSIQLYFGGRATAVASQD